MGTGVRTYVSARGEHAQHKTGTRGDRDRTPRVVPHIALGAYRGRPVAPLRVLLCVAERRLQAFDMRAQLAAQRVDALTGHVRGEPQHFLRISEQHAQILNDLLAAQSELLRRVSHRSLLTRVPPSRVSRCRVGAAFDSVPATRP